jgi:hypothetical protein
MSPFEYPITQPIRLGRWGVWLFWITATAYLVVITLLNVIAVGYESVLISLTGQTSTGKLWYQHLAFASWFPAATSCNPAELAFNEGT